MSKSKHQTAKQNQKFPFHFFFRFAVEGWGGVVTRNQTPLAKVSIKRLLTHRAYLGFVKHGDEWFDGNFEPIVTPALFESVQKVLQTKERPRKRKIKHDFPFTGLFRCAECGSMISAQWATGKSGGRYRYYRCSKKRGHCSQAYLQESELTRQICARLQTISLCDRYTSWMLDKVKMWEREEIGASQSEIQNLSNGIKANEERMEKLLSAYLDGDVPKDVYLKRKDMLMCSLAALKEQMKDFERGRNNWVEPLREWILDTKQANFLSSSSDLYQIKSFVQKIGTNPLVRDKSAHFAAPISSQFVAKRRALLPTPAPSARASSHLSDSEVSFCGDKGTMFAPTKSKPSVQPHSYMLTSERSLDFLSKQLGDRPRIPDEKYHGRSETLSEVARSSSAASQTW